MLKGVLFCLFCFVVVLGDWILGLTLVRKTLYHLSYAPDLFGLIIFRTGSHLGQPEPQSSYSYFLCSWDDRCAPPHPAVCWDGILLTFLVELTSNHYSTDLHLPNSCYYKYEPQHLTRKILQVEMEACWTVVQTVTTKLFLTIRRPLLCACISMSSILCHWHICLFLCSGVFVTMALKCNLK
jgi:hypothetical protein